MFGEPKETCGVGFSTPREAGFSWTFISQIPISILSQQEKTTIWINTC